MPQARQLAASSAWPAALAVDELLQRHAKLRLSQKVRDRRLLTALARCVPPILASADAAPCLNQRLGSPSERRSYVVCSSATQRERGSKTGARDAESRSQCTAWRPRRASSAGSRLGCPSSVTASVLQLNSDLVGREERGRRTSEEIIEGRRSVSRASYVAACSAVLRTTVASAKRAAAAAGNCDHGALNPMPTRCQATARAACQKRMPIAMKLRDRRGHDAVKMAKAPAVGTDNTSKNMQARKGN